jgi:hypothetical protein
VKIDFVFKNTLLEGEGEGDLYILKVELSGDPRPNDANSAVGWNLSCGQRIDAEPLDKARLQTALAQKYVGNFPGLQALVRVGRGPKEALVDPKRELIDLLSEESEVGNLARYDSLQELFLRLRDATKLCTSRLDQCVSLRL